MKKSAQVVILPTNEKALNLTPIVMYNNKLFSCYSGNYSYDKAIFQNLYILSDEEIKEGDWVYCLREGFEPVLKQKVNPIGVNNDKMFKKIIATTDRSLNTFIESKDGNYTEHGQGYFKELPQPSQSFIEKFVKEYNEGNVITEVLVEYEYDSYSTKTDGELTADLKLKINPDNTIDINMPKDSWSREEMLNLLESAWNGGALYGSSKPNSHYFDKWIEENL